MATNTTTIKEGLAKELLNDHQKEIESFQSILADFNENIYSLEDKLKEYIEDSCGHMRKYIEENVESYDELNIKLKQNNKISNEEATLLISRYKSCINFTHPSLFKLINQMKGFTNEINIGHFFDIDSCVNKYSYNEGIKKCSYENFTKNKEEAMNDIFSYYNEIIKY